MLFIFAMMLGGCATTPRHAEDRDALMRRAERTVTEFETADSTIADQLAKARGYAVFPTVGKGGAIVGGAFGRGIVYENGSMIGYCAIKQGTIGAQLGGQSYSELILFEDAYALDRFKREEFALAAQASAVAAASGSAANANYKDGVMVFTIGEEGLMVEASVGGQRFTFDPVLNGEQ